MKIRNQISTFLHQNISFFVMISGSISVFLSNIVFKQIFNDYEYGLYSILLTLIPIVFSFGLIGFDSLLLRRIKVLGFDVIIERKFVIFIILIIPIVGIIFGYTIQSIYFDKLMPLDMAILFFGIILLNISSNLLRLTNQYTSSQITLVSWKIILLVLGFILLLSDLTLLSIEGVIRIVSFATFIFGVLGFLFSFSTCSLSIVDRSTEKGGRGLYFGFLIANLTVSFMGYGERLLVEHKFGMTELADYFFTSSVILFPALTCQQYIVFKELPVIKGIESISALHVRLRRIVVFSIISNFLIFCMAYLGYLIAPGILSIDFKMGFLLGLIGCTRIIYGYLSSIANIKIDSTKLNRFNSIFIVLIICSSMLLPFIDELIIFIIMMFFLWMIRSVLLYKYLFRT